MALLVPLSLLGMLAGPWLEEAGAQEDVAKINTSGTEDQPVISLDGSRLCFLYSPIDFRFFQALPPHEKLKRLRIIGPYREGHTRADVFDRRILFRGYWSEKIDGRWTRPALAPHERMPREKGTYGKYMLIEGGKAIIAEAYGIDVDGETVRGKGDLVVFRKERDGKWEGPALLSDHFNTPYMEQDFHVTQDGRTLILRSDRPGTLGFGDIFISHIDDGEWGKPRNLGSPINTKEGFEAPGWLSPDRQRIYFVRAYPQPRNVAKGGIYFSKKVGGRWAEPEKLDLGIRTHRLFAPSLTKDERTLYFEVLPPGGKDFQVYVSHRQRDGSWSVGVALGAAAVEEAALAQEAAGERVEDIERLDCEGSTGGWRIIDPARGKARLEGASLTITRAEGKRHDGQGALEFRYLRRRGRIPVLANPVVLTELRSLAFWVRSLNDATLVVAVTDRDGARFHRPLKVPSGRWTRVLVRPEEFRLNADSLVKKDKLDPGRLGAGFGLFDLAPALGIEGENTLWVDSIRIERQPLVRTSGPWVIDGREVRVARSTLHEGPVLVKNGGTLRITAPRFVLQGTLKVEGATVELSAATFSFRQRYRMEFRLKATHNSRIDFRDVTILSPHPVGLHLKEGSSATLHGVTLGLAGFHGEVAGGCRLTLDGARKAGEFLLAPGAKMSVSRSIGVLTWFMFAPNTKATLALPASEHVKQWQSASSLPMGLTITDSRMVMWGLVAPPGCDLTFKDTALLAAGLLFVGEGEQRVAGLRNKTRYDDFTLGLSDRKLRLVNTSVQAWNLYTGQQAKLTVDDCLFGEALAFHHSSVEIRDSTCDGSGGFVGCRQQATIHLRNSRLDCDVYTYDRSRLVLDGCTVKGSVTATGNAIVRLLNTAVQGSKRSFERARIVEEE